MPRLLRSSRSIGGAVILAMILTSTATTTSVTISLMLMMATPATDAPTIAATGTGMQTGHGIHRRTRSGGMRRRKSLPPSLPRPHLNRILRRGEGRTRLVRPQKSLLRPSDPPYPWMDIGTAVMTTMVAV